MVDAADRATPVALVYEERLDGADRRWAIVRIEERASTIGVSADIRNRHPAGDAWHYAAHLQLELAVTDPARCMIDGHARTWDLESHTDGAFEELIAWVLYQLWDAELVELDPTLSDHAASIAHSRTEDVRGRMEEIAKRAASRAIELCDSAARDAVLGFASETRFYVYAALLADPTGRIRQMIDVCPGVLTLAAGDRTSAQARAVANGIRDGLTLSEVIKLALPIAHAEHRAASAAPLSRWASALVRRAPTMPFADLVHLLHAPGLDINDLHGVRSRAAKRAWFRLLSAWGIWARRIDTDRAANIGAFISRGGLAAGGFGGASSFILSILDWLQSPGSVELTRRTSPKRILRMMDVWRSNVDPEADHHPHTRLPPGPVTSCEIAGVTATAIETVGQLIAEGDEMAHCVASLANEAVAGEMCFYRATVGGARVTVAIGGSPGGWFVRSAVGVRNRPLSPGEDALIRRWVKAVR